MTEKVDLKKTLEGYRAPQGRFRELDVPTSRYLAVDGHGDPNTSPAFTRAVETLYPVAYRLKFASRNDLGRDYVVPPLEGLWSAQGMDAYTSARDKTRWDWTLMLLVPDWIETALAVSVLDEAGRPPSGPGLRVETLAEGRCVQTLHVGAYDDEADVLARLHREYLPEHGLKPTGRHHEIYLSDARRVAPEKRRTILRQPVAVA